jgi:hypothetical protein
MIPRTLLSKLQRAAGPFPVLFLTGPRQSGKTTLARAAFPDYIYLSLEDPSGGRKRWKTRVGCWKGCAPPRGVRTAALLSG